MDEVWGSLLVAVIGGLVGGLPAWWSVRKTMQVKHDETIAPRRVEALAEAQNRLTLMPVGTAETEPCLELMKTHHDWFVENSPFLGGVWWKWLSLHGALSHARNSASILRRKGDKATALEVELLSDVEGDAMRLHREALQIIRDELKAQPGIIERPWMEREQKARALEGKKPKPGV